MADIKHSIQTSATPEQVYSLVTTAKGLGQWWATDIPGHRLPSSPCQGTGADACRLGVRIRRRMERDPHHFRLGNNYVGHAHQVHPRRLARGDRIVYVVQHDLGRTDVPLESCG